MMEAGTRIGHLRVLERLGKGGMGEVFIAEDELLERRVAVKTIRRDASCSAESAARFLREARLLSKLEHPNICRVYDLVSGDDSDLLVMELLDGVTLGQRAVPGLDRDRLLAVAEGIAAALEARYHYALGDLTAAVDRARQARQIAGPS